MNYFHGGFPGLNVGDFIDPPDVTLSTVTLSKYAAELGAVHGTRRDVVYVTTRQDTARAFAAVYTDGALYRVEPVDVIGPDPDAPDESIMCRRAHVLEVVRRRVVFAHRTPESWLRMLTG